MQPCLHVDVLVPQLVDAREQRDGAVPHVARVVHKLVRHLHLRVLEPERGAAVVMHQRALPDGARSLEVLLRLLPFRVLDPDRRVGSDNSLVRFGLVSVASEPAPLQARAAGLDRGE